MADSDNTTTLPRVTRRGVLAITANAKEGRQPKKLVGDHAEAVQSADPAVAAWREWLIAHKEVERLCHQQQRLERNLVETIGFPCATIPLHDGTSVRLHSIQALNEVLGSGPEDEAVRAKSKADLETHQQRWEAADREIGYSAALIAEGEAADQAENLLQLLLETPAASLAGVAAKLDAVLSEGEPAEACAEFPWPHIRSVLGDVIRIGQEVMPEQILTNRLGTSKCGRRRGCIIGISNGAKGDAA
ncbi:hypothetical protein EN817_25330 [Mesorhizobium sp. M3A.F.Ca.ET.174.01.1.1]|uniref:hypothetical protein n=1 Tax=unclassified Mesorhizobium TaxID=325217 RepID=UPI001093F6E3|nr:MULTISPECIES: hypothetical protein [unclassified Mesorhizobium]TGS64972.1 hypothetical protein EN844_20015 [Mesorhizobium sp. M3A.F.Ca.ET.201.01.1.1]TGS82766.1 hypothetical protein EN818_25380 [Mesorhizobium sp. M3A.F.Ca.ET.175.01.1.1]TGT22721.1 hypothetical protein EN817_25330 [Mesorhizobium sp. M3A.F.Ca.ET.174.01.1.1]